MIGIGSRKRRRETEEASPSADAVSEKNLKETPPIILARWKTAAYKGSSAPPKLAELMKGMEVSTSLTTEEDFRLQKANTKRGSTSGQTWEVDVSKEWLSTQHQATGKQVTSDPLEKNATRNTARPWWVALETMKELENCLKKLDSGVSRKRRHWATQQKAEVNKLELKNQLVAILRKPADGIFRRGAENTVVGVAADGESFCQNGRTVDVRVEIGGSSARGVNLARYIEAGQQESTGLSDAGAACCQR